MINGNFGGLFFSIGVNRCFFIWCIGIVGMFQVNVRECFMVVLISSVLINSGFVV